MAAAKIERNLQRCHAASAQSEDEVDRYLKRTGTSFSRGVCVARKRRILVTGRPPQRAGGPKKWLGLKRSLKTRVTKRLDKSSTVSERVHENGIPPV